MKEKVYINFWNYYNIETQDENNVREWKQLGMTSIMSGECKEVSIDGKDKIVSLLTECEKQNMPVVLFDARFRLNTYKCVGAEQYRKGVKDAMAFYEQFSVAKYAFVYDEPSTDEDWQMMYHACQIISEESKIIKPFCSLNHYCGKAKKVVMKRLEEYYQAVKPEILLYNCYSQCFEREEQKEQGLENYFYNLNLFGEFARKHNITLATSLICCGHWSFRCPTQDDIRWQLYTAFAHGVQGLYWYRPLDRGPLGMGMNNNYRGFPINLFGERTPEFSALSYENKHFIADIQAAGLAEGAKLEKVYHVFRSYGGFPYFEKGEDEYVFEVQNPYNQPLTLSRFIRADGSRVIMIVNNSQRSFAEITVSFQEHLNHKKETTFLAPGSAKFIEMEKV